MTAITLPVQNIEELGELWVALRERDSTLYARTRKEVADVKATEVPGRESDHALAKNLLRLTRASRDRVQNLLLEVEQLIKANAESGI